MKIKKIINIFNSPLLLISNLLIPLVPFYMALKRYDTYLFGKFDLGNMNQMLFNSTRFNYMLITDYFGSNVARWSMSHVDPSLLIFIPINIFYTDANFLLLVQNFCFILSSILVFLISKQYGLSNFKSWLLSLVVFLMPITGFILVWTTFHPPVISVPIFLLIYYFLLVQKNKAFFTSLGVTIVITVLVILFILGKEELGGVFAVSSLFLIDQFPKYKKLLIKLGILSLVWSIICFFVIIPHYSNTRVQSMQNFNSREEVSGDFEDISSNNYFLYRYSELGDSYTDILLNIVLNPENFILILISPQNLNTLNQVLLPSLYSIFINPYLLIAFIPETLIQLLSGDSEVFSITNHRLLPILPFLFLGNILLFAKLNQKIKKYSIFLLVFFVLLNIYLSVNYKSPFVYGVYDKFGKIVNRVLGDTVTASNSSSAEFEADITEKCVDFLLHNIEPNDKVSVPQPLGAKTSNRFYNALFPTGVDVADVVIADIYDRKIADFLDVTVGLNKKIISKYLNRGDYFLQNSCDRFFLFKRGQDTSFNLKSLGKINIINVGEQQFKNSDKILENSYFVSYLASSKNGKLFLNYKYYLGEEDSRGEMFSYTILVGKNSRWQFVNLPSFYLNPIDDIPINALVEEDFNISVPGYIKNGTYKIFFGVGDKIRNDQNVYIGEIEL